MAKPSPPATEGRVAPAPPGNPIWGHTVQFQKDPRTFISRIHKEYGNTVRFRVLQLWWYMLSDPADVYEVLVKRPSEFNKSRLNGQIFRLFLGKGILSSDGEFWKKHHKMIRPAFHRQRIENYAQVMTDFTHEMTRDWQAGEQLDFQDEMTELTLAIVAKCLFDADVRQGDAKVVGRSMKVINEVLVDHINFPIELPRWWPSRRNKRKLAAIDDIEAIIRRLIRERQASGEDHGDLLSMLVSAETEDGYKMDETQLRDEAMTLFFAGHETTAHTLTWIWYLIGTHPEVEAKLIEEVDTVLGGAVASVENIKELTYLDQVIKEGMRLWPSVWTFMREPIEDTVIGGYEVPKDSQIFISPYVMHRNPEYFPDPDTFKPERFTREMEKALPKGAYLPFSMGPRVCLGKAFANMESRLILAALLQRVRPGVMPDYTPDVLAKLSMHPGNGLPVTVQFREDSPVQAVA